MTDYQKKRARRLYDDVRDLPEELRNRLVDQLLGVEIDDAEQKRQEIELTIASDLTEEIEYRHQHWNELIGLRTGYRYIDQMTMGLAPGELIIVGGRTSSGKTATCINIAANILKTGKPVLFVTLEMTQEEVGSRFYHVLGKQLWGEVSSLLFFQKSDELDWQSIDDLMEYAKKECGVELVIIDHLHYFTRELRNVAEDIGRITKEFKKNAIRHKLPVMLISHTRKTNADSPGNDDLRGSSYIAQDADIVLMVAQEEDQPGVIIVTLTKNRNRFGVKKIPASVGFVFKDTRIIEP